MSNPTPGWEQQAAAEQAAYQSRLQLNAARVSGEWAGANPQRAQELRDAQEVARAARREATAAAEALAQHKAAPPTSRDELADWKAKAIELTAEAEGLEMLATQAEQRADALRRGASVDAARLAQQRLADTRAAVMQRVHDGVRRLEELRQELDAAAAEVERDVYAAYERTAPYVDALVALNVEHLPDYVWRSRVGLTNGWTRKITR